MSVLSLLDPTLAAATRIHRASSQRLARVIQAQERNCYCNALSTLPRLAAATYVEGVVVIQNGLRFEHAWLEASGGVVDPTPVYAAMPKRACTYFAGPRWTLDEIQELFASGQDAIATPILGYDFADTPRRRAWITATLAAFRHASALHLLQTGRPAIDTEQQDSMLEALIGRGWADRLRAEYAGLGHPAPVALQR